MPFRESILNDYSGLFQGATLESEEEADQAIEDSKTEDPFKWFKVIYRLSQGDITRFDSVEELPLILCFNFLSYEVTEADKEKAKNQRR